MMAVPWGSRVRILLMDRNLLALVVGQGATNETVLCEWPTSEGTQCANFHHRHITVIIPPYSHLPPREPA